MFGGTAYLLGRAHGIIAKVLTKSQISFLLTADNLKELQAAFTQTVYGPLVSDLNFETELPAVARRFKSYFADILGDFYSQGSSATTKKMKLFSDRYHAENLRTVLRGTYMEKTNEEILERIIPLSTYTYQYYENLLNKSIPMMIAEQKDSVLNRLLKDAYSEFESTGRFVPVDSAIDQYEYQLLPKISKEYDIYVNMKNILSLCRCITLKVPAYRYILPTKFIAKALNAKTISEVLYMYNFGPYKEVFSEYLGRDSIPLHELELTVERYLLKKWRKLFRYGTVFNINTLIAFLELKLAEISDVVRIIVGVHAGFSEEEIKNSLLYYEL